MSRIKDLFIGVIFFIILIIFFCFDNDKEMID